MKKALLIGLAIIVACTLMVGCGDASAETGGLHYKKIEMNFRGEPTRIYVDPETGVQYIVFSDWHGRGYGIGITPRLNADGTVMVERN